MVHVKDIPTIEIMADNITRLMLDAPPVYWHDGALWYLQAQADCERIASATGYTMRQVAHIVAIMSPQKAWADNLLDARDACATFATIRELPYDDQPVAWRAAISRERNGRGIFVQVSQLRESAFVLSFAENVEPRGLETLSGAITGPKRRAFVTNILYPNGIKTIDPHLRLIDDEVTVDSHAVRIALDDVDDSGTFPLSRYEQFASAYRLALPGYDIPALHKQATTWLYWRATRTRSTGRKHHKVVSENRDRGYVP